MYISSIWRLPFFGDDLICFLGERLPPRSSEVDLRADERSPSRETGFRSACRTAERPRQKQIGQAPSGNRGAARQRVHPEVHREALQVLACQPRKLDEEARCQETEAVKSYGGFGTFEPLGPTYLERDIPSFGLRIPAETLRRFWTMLAHEQGGLLNAAKLAGNLSVSGQSVARYLDLLVDLMLVRRLPPWHSNAEKRLVKSPKVYIRDSGLTHALLGIKSQKDLLGHPVVGGSWEGFCIENLIAAAPRGTEASFYRSSAGAEIDLVLKLPQGQIWGIEIKRTTSPKVTRGFHHTAEELEVSERILVYADEKDVSGQGGVRAMPLRSALDRLACEGPCG